MKRAFFTCLLLAAALGVGGCETADPGAGSNTNWLRPCLVDEECADGFSCLCGVCSAPCEQECTDHPDAVCAPQGSAAQLAACGVEPLPGTGMCLPSCSAEAPCQAEQLCSEGRCLWLGSASESSCAPGARLSVTTGEVELEARYGTLFGDALYLPVSYDERPADWVDPMQPAAIVARVTDADGQPVSGCAVRFIAGGESGSAFADAAETNAAGEVTAYWVAGASRDQLLTAALVDQQGAVASQSVAGTAYANDEGPQALDAAATVVARPATLTVGYELPASASQMRVELSPEGFPHHAFYAALYTVGFFAGLQNTGDLDSAAGEVADEDRVLIASVWNLAEGDAQLLFQGEGMTCGPHQQDLGGIRCTRGGAWQLNRSYVFTLERRQLAMGEAGAGYAELGYAVEPCASLSGCTDYSLFFAAAGAAEPPERVVAYRYQSAEVAGNFGSFVEPYLEQAAQTSCLATPLYDASFLPSVLVGAEFQPVASAGFSATYRTWHNEVCANYEASSKPNGFRLATGGPHALGRPDLPGEPTRTLELP